MVLHVACRESKVDWQHQVQIHGRIGLAECVLVPFATVNSSLHDASQPELARPRQDHNVIMPSRFDPLAKRLTPTFMELA